MTKHLVLGTGNLGLDLAYALRTSAMKPVVLGRSNSSLHAYFDFNGVDGETAARDGKLGLTIRDLQDLKPDVIWCTIGAGGPGSQTLTKQLHAHLTLPALLAGWAPKLVLFSTAYLNNDIGGWYSDYALTKHMMELTMQKRENVRCFRVGSLYGNHYPLKCLPGKILSASREGRLNRAAFNKITPTPTQWLAESLVQGKVWERFREVPPHFNWAPSGSCSVKTWMEMILWDLEGKQMPEVTSAYDSNYPEDSAANIIVGQSWLSLWEENCGRFYKAFKSAYRAPRTPALTL